MERAHGWVYTRDRAVNVCGGLDGGGRNSNSCIQLRSGVEGADPIYQTPLVTPAIPEENLEFLSREAHREAFCAPMHSIDPSSTETLDDPDPYWNMKIPFVPTRPEHDMKLALISNSLGSTTIDLDEPRTIEKDPLPDRKPE